MRIAFFVKSKRRTRTTRSIADALRRTGHEVLALNERRRRRLLGDLASRAWTLHSLARFRPDVVLIHANDMSRGVFDAIAPHYRTALFTPDCWNLPLTVGELGYAPRVDLVLTVAAGQIPDLLEAGVRHAVYLAEACDPTVHFPDVADAPSWRCEVAFIGKTSVSSARHSPRTALVRRIYERFDTRVYGAGWDAAGISAASTSIAPPQYRRVCRGAGVVVGCDWNRDCRWYFSNRTWFTLGCGGFLITNHVPGLEEIFTNHRELVWYHTDGECLELIEHYLAKPEERDRISRAGLQYVLDHRTADHFARDLVDHLEGRAAGFPPPANTEGGRRNAG